MAGLSRHHLQRRGRTWYAVLTVPPALRAAVGKLRLVQSLETRSPLEAISRRDMVLGRWREHLAAIRQGVAKGPPPRVAFGSPQAHATGLLAEALTWREHLAAAPDDATREALELALTDRAADIAPPLGVDADGEPDHDPAHLRAARSFVAVALGRETPLGLLFEHWQAEMAGGYTSRTTVQHRITFKRFQAWAEGAGVPLTVEAIDRKTAGRFVSEALTGLEPATVARELSNLRVFWKWLGGKGYADEDRNPWSRQPVPGRTPGHRDEDGPKRRPFTDDEMRRLLTGGASPVLADAIRIAALSGMRAEEICNLRVADCAGGVFAIRAGKTPAAQREVPIHPGLAPIVARRASDKPPEAFLFTDRDLGLEQPGDDRARTLVKRFKTYRESLGVDDRPPGKRQSRVCFHSFRHGFVTAALRAGHPESVVAAVAGHKWRTMTFGLYGASGPTLAQKRVVVESVRLPSPDPEPARAPADLPAAPPEPPQGASAPPGAAPSRPSRRGSGAPPRPA
jgi:integrase